MGVAWFGHPGKAPDSVRGNHGRGAGGEVVKLLEERRDAACQDLQIRYRVAISVEAEKHGADVAEYRRGPERRAAPTGRWTNNERVDRPRARTGLTCTEQARDRAMAARRE